MKTLPDKGVIIRCVTTDQKVVGSTPAERTNVHNGLTESGEPLQCWGHNMNQVGPKHSIGGLPSHPTQQIKYKLKNMRVVLCFAKN